MIDIGKQDVTISCDQCNTKHVVKIDDVIDGKSITCMCGRILVLHDKDDGFKNIKDMLKDVSGSINDK